MRENYNFHCDMSRCRGVNYCDAYNMTDVNLTLTLGPDVNVTINEKDLLMDLHNDDEYNCQFTLFNSGKRMILGNVFLKNYYTIYDIQDYKIGLGPVKLAVIPEPIDPRSEEVPDDVVVPDTPEDIPEDSPKDDSGYTLEYEGAAIFLISISVAILCLCCCIKVRQKEEPEGSLIPRESSLSGRDPEMERIRQKRLQKMSAGAASVEDDLL